MTTFVLILILFASSGIATTTAEFDTKVKCEAAGASAKAETPWATVLKFVCAEK